MKKKKSSSKKSQRRSQSYKKKSQLNQHAKSPHHEENDASSVVASPLNSEKPSDDVQNEIITVTEHIDNISDKVEAPKEESVADERTKDVVYPEKIEGTAKDISPEKTNVTVEEVPLKTGEKQAENQQSEVIRDEEIERVTAVLSAVPSTEKPDEPMLFKKEKIRKHKPYYYVRGWLLVALMFVLSGGATGLTFITIERLYLNLSPYLGVYFGALAVIALLHVLINVNRLPYWGFTIFPILVSGAIGVILLAFDQYIDNIFYMYVIIGIWSVAMLAFVHSMLLKSLMPKGWFFLMLPSIIVVAAAVICSFYPFVLSYGDAIGIIYDAVSAVTPLMITRVFFIAITVVMFIDAIIWFIVKVQEKDRLGLTRSRKKSEKANRKKEEQTNRLREETSSKADDHQDGQPVEAPSDDPGHETPEIGEH